MAKAKTIKEMCSEHLDHVFEQFSANIFVNGEQVSALKDCNCYVTRTVVEPGDLIRLSEDGPRYTADLVIHDDMIETYRFNIERVWPNGR